MYSTYMRTMKKMMLLLLFLAGIGKANAQIQEGDIMLGSDLGSGLVATGSDGLFGLNFGLNDGAGFSVGVSPKVGYFLNQNFLVGAAVNLGFSKSPENNGEATETMSYGFQGLTRFYIRPNEVDANELPARSMLFLENNAGVAGLNNNDGPSTFGFAFGFGPGLAYFVSDNVALETTVKYNGLIGGGTVDYQHSLGINLGVQVFLSRTNAEQIFERPNTN